MKILTVIGARPQFIKASPVSRAIAARGDIDEILLHTGQHYDANMSDVFFHELGIPAPKIHLGVGSGGHGAQTARMLEGIEKALIVEKPDMVMVYGDTNSTLAGALAAVKLHIPIAHVEAGLRSFNREMPEEINRIVADCVSDLLFVPHESAAKQLLSEGISAEKISVVGDVMYDVMLQFRKTRNTAIFGKLGIKPKQYILATIHRSENTDDKAKLTAIMKAVSKVAESTPVVFPIHPRTRKQCELWGLLAAPNPNLKIVEPLSYLEMIALETDSAVIATDSGGVQKEAFFCQVPCITLRTETEWVELVELGWNQLVTPSNPTQIADKILRARNTQGKSGNPYGDGNAAGRIVAGICAYLNRPHRKAA